MTTNTILNIIRRKTFTLLIVCVGVGTILNYLFSNNAIAQNLAQTESQPATTVANVNEVKTFIYSWFALLDRQVSEISLFKFLDKDNLTMQFPEMTVNNPDDFSKWYLGVQKAIISNTHDVQQVEVTPKGNGEFDVKVEVNWQAQTRDGEAIDRAYQQQWKIITDPNRRLLIQEYLVEEIE